LACSREIDRSAIFSLGHITNPLSPSPFAQPPRPELDILSLVNIDVLPVAYLVSFYLHVDRRRSLLIEAWIYKRGGIWGSLFVSYRTYECIAAYGKTSET